MLKQLLYPLGVAVGAIGTDWVAAKLPIPHGVGPNGPEPLSPLAKWGLPALFLVGGSYLGRHCPPAAKGLCLGVAVNGGLHLAGTAMQRLDVNFGGAY